MMGISENVEEDFSTHPTNYKGDCVRVCMGRGGRDWGEEGGGVGGSHWLADAVNPFGIYHADFWNCRSVEQFLPYCCAESHFNASLSVTDKVTRKCPQTTTSEERGQPKRNRTKVLLLTSLTPYRYAKPAHKRDIGALTPSDTLSMQRL